MLACQLWKSFSAFSRIVGAVVDRFAICSVDLDGVVIIGSDDRDVAMIIVDFDDPMEAHNVDGESRFYADSRWFDFYG